MSSSQREQRSSRAHHAQNRQCMLAKAGIEETFRFAFKGVSSHIPQQLAVIQTSDQDNPEQRMGTILHIGPTESSACHIRLAG
jgi:hypothetical protein